MKNIALVIAGAVALAGCHSKDRFMGSAPTATDPVVGQIGSATAVVEWSTSEPMRSEIQYGPDNGYGSVLGVSGSPQSTHRVTLAGLPPSTLFHFRVKNHSPGGETVFSYDRIFRTAGAGSTLPLSGSYGFDSGVEGWENQTYADSRSVSTVGWVSSPVYFGPGALRLDVDLRVGDDALSKGEAFVQFKSQAPGGVPMDFIDLDLKGISVFVFAPSGAIGDTGAPNGIQLFAKDTSGRSEYGPYTNIVEGAWFSVSYVPGDAGNAFTSPGFDPTRVASIGVKVGVGGASGGPNYAGPIYVDMVTFSSPSVPI